jgi:hypothetical protein
LKGEPCPGAAHAGLDLVDDEQGSRRCGQLTGEPQVCRVSGDDSSLALEGLQEERRDVGADRRPQSRFVVQRDMGD